LDLHANLFRTTFSDPEQAAGLLRTFLPPALAAAIDWTTLSLCDPGFVDQDVRHSDADLLFSVSMGGRPAFVHLLVEHKSSDEPLTAFQVLRYVVRIQEQWLRDHPGTGRLPPVVPLVVHHGPRCWRSATDVVELVDLDGLEAGVADLLRPLLPRLRFLLADLPEVTLERLRRLAMPPLARLVLVCLQHVRGMDGASALLAVRTAIDLVRQVHAMRGGGERLDQVWYYSLRVSDLGPEQVRDLLEALVDPSAGGTVKTAYDRIGEEVRARTLLRQIEKRFGTIPEDLRSRVLSAPAAELDRWLDRILDAPTLEVLFED
jgi:hypothetical protein